MQLLDHVETTPTTVEASLIVNRAIDYIVSEASFPTSIQFD